MTNFQKAVCVLLSLCFLAVLVWMPEPFLKEGNVYRQIPLYCFLESEAEKENYNSDWETKEKIIAMNGAYLMEQALKEQALKEQALKEQAGSLSDAQNSDVLQETPTPVPQDSSDDTEKAPKHFQEEEDTAAAEASAVPHPVIDLSPERLLDYDYLQNQFFIIDSNANVSDGLLNAAEFLGMDLTMKQDASAPQILIYHTHSQETFVDSREGKTEDTVVGVGDYLTEILTGKYGYHVIHVTETFDLMGGTLDRNSAYDYAREYLEKYLQENPSVEVLIDLHRDGVSENRHLVTEINGKPTAQIMFYNGLSNTVSQGNVDYLPNPYIKDNLAFSFQLEYQAAEYYPDFYRGIYLAGLRYNLHLRPKSLLLEAGAQTNTLQEVKNAMEPFADILHRVLKGSDNGR